MDKNVQHVDLDEIRKAREALNNELGITTPQDNYSKKTKKQEEETPLSNTAENNDNNDLDSQSNFNELDEEENVDRDFSVYDNFSQFEINKDIELKDNSPKKVEPVEIEEDEEDDYEEFVEEEKPELQKPTDLDDLLANITSIDDLMNMDLSGIQISEDENVGKPYGW